MKTPAFESFGARLRGEVSVKAALELSASQGSIKTLLLISGDRTAREKVLHSMAAQATLSSPSPQVLHISAIALGQVMSDASRRGRLFQLEEELIRLDWLLIDDWQSLPKDRGLQETLCVVFDRLFDRGRNLVVASDREVASLSWLTPRLKSRFERSVTLRLVTAQEVEKNESRPSPRQDKVHA